jgi:hypothetical protein
VSSHRLAFVLALAALLELADRARASVRAALTPRRALAFLLALTAAFALAATCPAQTPPPTPPAGPRARAAHLPGPAAPWAMQGYVTGQALALLRAEWNATYPYQTERAYCVRHHLTGVSADGTTTHIVTEIARARVKWATVNAVNFECPDGAPNVHTHPPADCNMAGTGCRLSSQYVDIGCPPSAQDRKQARERGLPFAVVMCGPDTFTFYAPAGRVMARAK